MHTKKKLGLLVICFIVSLLFISFNTADAATKLKYNGKKVTYKKSLVNVNINNKNISLGKTKGILINDTSMVPYDLVFKSGLKASTSYSSKSKKLKISKNGVTINLVVGKKTCYVNGKKSTLPVAPVSVNYISAKKTKILVPAQYITTKLKCTYSWNSSKKSSYIKTPFTISYNGKTYYYTKYKANLTWNSKNYSLGGMPGLCIGGGTLLPGKEVFQTRMGMIYNYDNSTGKITISTPDHSTEIVMYLNSKTALVNGTRYTMPLTPLKIKRLDKNKTVICVPGAFVATKLGYYYKWNSNANRSMIHQKDYFSWKTDESNADLTGYSNSIQQFSSKYNMDRYCTSFTLTGLSATDMANSTVVRNGKTLTLTIPNTKYAINTSTFQKFYENIASMKVTQSGSNTIIQFNGTCALDYSNSINGTSITLDIYGDYAGKWSLKIKRPSGVAYSTITDADYYNSKKFKIYLKGNHIAFFKKNPVIINNDKIKSVSYELTSGGNTAICVTTNSIQGYKLYNSSDYVSVDVDSPRNIYKKIVVLDAGHGGHDPGAIGYGIHESDLNLKIMYSVMKSNFTSKSAVKAYWTRSSNVFVTLSDRAAFAKKVGADMFVSLHMNSWTKSSVNGTEVYYSASNNKKSFSGITSKIMANKFLTKLVSVMGTTNRGISAQRYTVVHKNTVPAVLIELGFISGSSDHKKITNSSYQKKAAKGIYDTINSLFNSYPTGR